MGHYSHYKKLRLVAFTNEDAVCVWLDATNYWEDICVGEGKTTKGALKHAIKNLEKHLADAKKMLDKL